LVVPLVWPEGGDLGAAGEQVGLARGCQPAGGTEARRRPGTQRPRRAGDTALG
jgi:hypothetical protein